MIGKPVFFRKSYPQPVIHSLDIPEALIPPPREMVIDRMSFIRMVCA